MNDNDPTYQRIRKSTQKKFQAIAKEDKRTVPALLDVIAERELKKYPNLAQAKRDYLEGKWQRS